jgi:hypothetical protein
MKNHENDGRNERQSSPAATGQTLSLTNLRIHWLADSEKYTGTWRPVLILRKYSRNARDEITGFYQPHVWLSRLQHSKGSTTMQTEIKAAEEPRQNKNTFLALTYCIKDTKNRNLTDKVELSSQWT